MRITENQIRRIIRKSLRRSLLSEGASNWNEYVQQTGDKGIAQPDVMKDLYFKLVNSEWQTHVKDNGKLLRDAGFVDGQTDSYNDYVSWYKRFNETDFGKSMRAPEERRWLSPEDIIEALEGFVQQIDKGQVGTAEDNDVDVEVEVEELDPVELASKAKLRRQRRRKGREDRKEIRKDKRKQISKSRQSQRDDNRGDEE